MKPRPRLETLLYIDDDHDIREIVQMALGLIADLTVHVCESGERALKLLPGLKPDLVLLDVMMPGMDGPTTLSLMRADPALAGIPVIFMTAKAMPHEVARFRQLGAAGVVAKPFDPMLLGQQVLALWQGMGEEIQPPVSETRAEPRKPDQLGERFLRRCQGEVASLREFLQRLRDGDAAALAQMEALAHRITGTGATLGFASLSEHASDIERLAGKYRGSDTLPAAQEIGLLEVGVAHLADAIEANLGSPGPTEAHA